MLRAGSMLPGDHFSQAAVPEPLVQAAAPKLLVQAALQAFNEPNGSFRYFTLFKIWAVSHTWLGQKDQAFADLQRAHDQHNTCSSCCMLTRDWIRCALIRALPRWQTDFTKTSSPAYERSPALE